MCDRFLTPRLGACVFVGLFLLPVAPGCGGGAGAYTPDPVTARRALESALTAWQNGSKPDQLATASPPVNVVDGEWQAGKSLERFEVGGEENSEGAAKRFAVTLTMKKATPGEVKTEYVVVGRDPVWVYRAEDYDRFTNMDNNPVPKKSKPRR